VQELGEAIEAIEEAAKEDKADQSFLKLIGGTSAGKSILQWARASLQARGHESKVSELKSKVEEELNKITGSGLGVINDEDARNDLQGVVASIKRLRKDYKKDSPILEQLNEIEKEITGKAQFEYTEGLRKLMTGAIEGCLKMMTNDTNCGDELIRPLGEAEEHLSNGISNVCGGYLPKDTKNKMITLNAELPNLMNLLAYQASRTAMNEDAAQKPLPSKVAKALENFTVDPFHDAGVPEELLAKLHTLVTQPLRNLVKTNAADKGKEIAKQLIQSPLLIHLFF